MAMPASGRDPVREALNGILVILLTNEWRSL